MSFDILFVGNVKGESYDEIWLQAVMEALNNQLDLA